MIDSEWFYRQFEKEGRSLRDMARKLGLDPSAVSRMLRGERKMSAEEQDGIADYFGISLDEVAARRRGAVFGFDERGQEPFRTDIDAGDEKAASRVSRQADESEELGRTDSFFDRIRGRMAGTVTIPPGVDLTEPADPEWARVYDDDYEYPLHL